MSKMKFIEKEVESKKIPAFKVGDTLKIHIRVKEGDKTRLQLFEGVAFARRDAARTQAFQS